MHRETREPQRVIQEGQAWGSRIGWWLVDIWEKKPAGGNQGQIAESGGK